jgi:hypothetical protein
MMLTLQTKIERSENAPQIDGQLILPYELREKSRLRATLQSGEDVAVFTVRGTVMRDGDLMLAMAALFRCWRRLSLPTKSNVRMRLHCCVVHSIWETGTRRHNWAMAFCVSAKTRY